MSNLNNQLEPEDLIEWKQHPATHHFLAYLESRKDTYLKQAMNSAIADKDVTVALVRAKTLNEILDYAKGLRSDNRD